MLSILTTFVPFLLFVQQNQVTNGVPQVAFCEVLHDLAKYRGMIIEVQAEWDGAERSLIGDCSTLKIRGQSWPNEIVLQVPDDPDVQREQPAHWKTPPFEIYDFAHRGAWAEWERLPSEKRENTSVFVTVVGRLDSRIVSGDDREDFGYGHLGYAPARLVVIEIKRIQIKSVTRRVARPFPSGPAVAR